MPQKLTSFGSAPNTFEAVSPTKGLYSPLGGGTILTITTDGSRPSWPHSTLKAVPVSPPSWVTLSRDSSSPLHDGTAYRVAFLQVSNFGLGALNCSLTRSR